MLTRLPMREELFAHEVAAFTPPDRAYLLAGFKSRPEFARANACRLLRKAAVVRRVDELRAEFRERCALNVEYLQALLLPIVECNVLDCFEQAGQSAAPTASRKRKTGPALEAASSRLRFKPLDRLRREQGLAIAGLKLGENGSVVDIKFHGKNEAAKALMATLGIKDGEGASLALLELGSRLGAALARVGGKVIDHSDNSALPAPRATTSDAGADDDVVTVINC
jgi:hypothetical protein